MKTYNYIDIFAGCGGLSEGFEKNGQFNMLAAVEWEKPQVKNLVNRLKSKWNISDADNRVLRFDIQRTDELFHGWSNDDIFGNHNGLDSIIDGQELDLIIGGPPCQAYSVAGRIRDVNGMKDDYRNYLFEGYLAVVRRYSPKLFVFENVPGILSAKPGGVQVTDLIRKEIEASGYTIINDLKSYAQIDLTQYGIPQNRKRLIIVGIKKDLFHDPQQLLEEFYTNHLTTFKERVKTVRETIEDLPKLKPLQNELKLNGKKYSHEMNTSIPNHLPRYHSSRDIEIFKLLAEDIVNGDFKYTSSDKLKELYTLKTGKSSNVHKYHVIRWDKPSNTIPAHLYKDGLRHIHPDPLQARTITVREAARLQTFDDDYDFISSVGDNYKMIGNAVPPRFSEKLAQAIKIFLEKREA
ncbi:DNA cytosine methyltransferase [Sporosarcina aquimarina]|uniref:Cytosine-specific methyltransferase n=1 Tax=Sporosarcina aquimarina TaxID=114975 RepID=A0ABU4G2D9_9BACL|nr:DNA cytosine methyltransferase [Sporosarcina aquimarina]MDW0111133.1 DNA cytosine methyltransferase [Sporosarcina aquimarina]